MKSLQETIFLLKTITGGGGLTHVEEIIFLTVAREVARRRLLPRAKLLCKKMSHATEAHEFKDTCNVRV